MDSLLSPGFRRRTVNNSYWCHTFKDFGFHFSRCSARIFYQLIRDIIWKQVNAKTTARVIMFRRFSIKLHQFRINVYSTILTWTKADIKRLKAADTNFVKEYKPRGWGVKVIVRNDSIRDTI